ncbi:hypothetical protein BO94DRAFT_313212 [Aspergillus sclerotioniger CBS 115572]|uniref:Transmembrane protein n=1 Tax=Aspergillus sclerotioniger CBS 115572 TaxID=1450535 RepID=A0A317X5R0_9EURO|nr:hypothetical protein BO94DRAFT_313212 [Aspergillus sclerotioniger CBS 115572]PWY93913.1 hypothetical protein BO94DRAFT_313212 [Aspergillus sclerotioniger CBS 115572]
MAQTHVSGFTFGDVTLYGIVRPCQLVHHQRVNLVLLARFALLLSSCLLFSSLFFPLPFFFLFLSVPMLSVLSPFFALEPCVPHPAH